VRLPGDQPVMDLDPRVAAFDAAVDRELGGASPVPLSQTTSENPGAVHGLVAGRLAAEDAARMERLNKLIAAGKGNVPQTEIEMPKGKRSEPWPCCGSASFRHKKDCAKAGKKAEAPPATKPTRLAANKAGTGPDFSGYEVVQLLAIIVAAQAELERREEELKAQLDAIRLARAG
jgi:hypothetical protein